MDLEWMPDAGSLPCRLKGHLLAGISGGADSVYLFHLLLAAARNGDLTFEAVHVNHGIRGEASDGDERFVRELCAGYGIRVHVLRAELGPGTDEGKAREIRYGFFAECMEKCRADAVVLAHHLDDQAETFLLHLLRGAGPEGLGGMAPVSTRNGMKILRPLLELRRTEIREALTAHGIPWREDASNADPRYMRNALRLRLIPEIEKEFPGAALRIARTAETLRKENEAQDTAVNRFLENHSGRDWLETETLCTLPEALRRRILRKWWAAAFAETQDERALSYENTLALDALVMNGSRGKINLPAGAAAVRGNRHLHLTGLHQPEEDTVFFDFREKRVCGLTLKVTESRGTYGNGIDIQEFPGEFLQGTVLRTRRPGDRIRPFGMNGEQKLQDYLVNRKVDGPWRDRIPLLCREDEVLWVPGVGTGGIPRWKSDADNLRLEWTGEMPWKKRKEAEEHGTDRKDLSGCMQDSGYEGRDRRKSEGDRRADHKGL